MGRFFGTDGIRGRAGEPPLDPRTVQRIGRAVVRALGADTPRVLIGRDTRESSPGLESHLAAGARAEGAIVESAGVIPTPAIAHHARHGSYALGVVLSASHNPYEDNGIKVFSGCGRKFDQEMEARTEELIDSMQVPQLEAGPPEPVDLYDSYLGHLRSSYAGPPMTGRRIVLDCANGATSHLAQSLFEGLGAEVRMLAAAPDGRNINAACGATEPAGMARMVVEEKADLGVAFDGDGDRAIFADASGRIVDGDHVLFMVARHLKQQGRLSGDAVIATVMSNVGLEIALERLGIEMVRTAVGDRHVLAEMERRGVNLGGEQSGHVIFLDHEPSGDGLLTALKTLEVVTASGRTLAELAEDLEIFPQILLNVRVREKLDIESIPDVHESVAAAHASLDGRGRLLVRYSGTEPVLRVMAEGPDEGELRELAGRIAEAARRRLGS